MTNCYPDISEELFVWMNYGGCPRQSLVFEAFLRAEEAILSRFLFVGTLAGNMESTCGSNVGPDTA